MGLTRDRAHQRGVELGPYPLEALRRDIAAAPSSRRPPNTEEKFNPYPPTPLLNAVKRYQEIFAACTQQPKASKGEGTDDLKLRAREIKGAAYYLDAAAVGLCALESWHWFGHRLGYQIETKKEHTHAIVLLVAFGRPIEPTNLAHQWLAGSAQDIALMRGLEIGSSILGHIRALGYDADLHFGADAQLCIPTLSLSAGITQEKDGAIHHPFLGEKYVAVAITTDYAVAVDQPLARDAKMSALRYWRGVNGATSGREHAKQAKRASHQSRYPMEQVKRVDEPTTAIFAEEVPRVPKRAEFFMRARMGDLGEKAKREVARFAFKHPLTDGMMYPLRAMVPHQDGPTAENQDASMGDALTNSRAVKALSYHLGADLTGICEIPDYAWYSHGPDGQPIEIKHKYAVVMLIDQGHDTMEGASGDDWISGCQSMRGYIRGAEIAGVMAEFLRNSGHDARPQTNADSKVLQIPLVLLAGLGELSRIGELVLNPYVGPRFKSVVLTTNLPLVPDKPIDFGLQQFCSNCLKCARECPVNAIPFGDKVVFNGYEIWKPDVERCTSYRVTNPKGSACGRCMKTCPLNKVVSTDGALLHRVGTWLGVNAPWLKFLMVPIAVYLDDKLGYGRRNPTKRWWQDLELVDGVARKPRATNERDIDPTADTTGAKSPVGYYHAADMPPPDSTKPFPTDHKAAVERAALIETVAQASTRRQNSRTIPEHYIPLRDLSKET
ncbi:MAG: reductive dehalogenase [Limisphaerales bacterium]|jgi:reductive dehalogenase